MLLCTYSGGKEQRGTSQKGEKQSICPARPGTVDGGKTVEPPIQSILQHLLFVVYRLRFPENQYGDFVTENLLGNTNISGDSL
jgi:hypothetical protein